MERGSPLQTHNPQRTSISDWDHWTLKKYRDPGSKPVGISEEGNSCHNITTKTSPRRAQDHIDNWHVLRHRTKHGLPPSKATTDTPKNFNYNRNYANSTSPRMTRARGSTEDSASATMSQQIRCRPINKKLSRVSHPRPHQRPGHMRSNQPEVGKRDYFI